MNIENIRALAEIAKTYGLSSLEIEEGQTKINIGYTSPAPVSTQLLTAPVASAAPGPDSVTLANAVKAPIVGVFYAAASPDAEPFVSVGSKVKKGDVLCIIETMKLMNEVTAEQDGEITDVCVENGEVVEFGQALFKFL